jgi:hypothetical protein
MKTVMRFLDSEGLCPVSFNSARHHATLFQVFHLLEFRIFADKLR